jgi:hypothetical protein
MCGGQVNYLAYDGTTDSKRRLRCGGQLEYPTDGSWVESAMAAPDLNAVLRFGNDNGADYPMKGYVRAVVVYKGVLSAADVTTVWNALKTKWVSGRQIIFEGDSLIALGSTDGSETSTPLAIVSGTVQSGLIRNFAVGGSDVAAMAARSAAVDAVTSVSGKVSLEVVRIGSNDITTTAAATVYSDLVDYVEARRSAGCQKFVWIAVTPRLEAETGCGLTTYDSRRASLAALAKADVGTVWDAVIDLCDSTDDPTYYTDFQNASGSFYDQSNKPHASVVGDNAVAVVIQPYIDEILLEDAPTGVTGSLTLAANATVGTAITGTFDLSGTFSGTGSLTIIASNGTNTQLTSGTLTAGGTLSFPTTSTANTFTALFKAPGSPTITATGTSSEYDFGSSVGTVTIGANVLTATSQTTGTLGVLQYGTVTMSQAEGVSVTVNSASTGVTFTGLPLVLNGTVSTSGTVGMTPTWAGAITPVFTAADAYGNVLTPGTLTGITTPGTTITASGSGNHHD